MLDGPASGLLLAFPGSERKPGRRAPKAQEGPADSFCSWQTPVRQGIMDAAAPGNQQMGNDIYNLADTWHLNNRVNLMLLDHLRDEQLVVAANPRARSIGDQFAHLHNVRIMWLETFGSSSAPACWVIRQNSPLSSANEEVRESCQSIPPISNGKNIRQRR